MSISERTIALVAIFNGNGEMLLLKRPEDVHCGGLWSLPGGKVEAGEGPLTAARRELFEETGLRGAAWRFIGEHEHAYPDRHLRFSLFACLAEGDAGLPGETHAWVSQSALDRYPMPLANEGLMGLLAGMS